jgi:hypothetical protein
VLSFLALGLLIGLRHALEPDHVAAVASLATRGGTLRDHARTGALWGAGHALALLLLGGTCVVLGLVIPETTGRFLEGAVGAMLVLLGISVFVRMRRQGIHFHVHEHPGGRVHVHPHAHDGALEHGHARAHEHEHGYGNRSLKTLAVGAMHGMAGSAALVLLVGSSARSPLLGVLYIAAFGVGATCGMMALAATIALPLGRSARGRTALYRSFCGLAGVTSIVIGVHLVWLLVASRTAGAA